MINNYHCILGTGHQLWGGGATKLKVGQVKFYPRKTGAEKVLAVMKEGTKRFGVVLVQELEVLVLLKGGAKKFYPLKWGA